MPRSLWDYVLCCRNERISVKIEARDRNQIGDSASISQRRDRSRAAAAVDRMTYFNNLLADENNSESCSPNAICACTTLQEWDYEC